MAKDTFYFSHDYNVRNDSKIKKLLSVHGYLGYGLWWAIVEDLYNNTNVLRLDYQSISFDLRTSAETIKSIINDFDLFVFDGENFGSLSVQKRLDERNEKSNKARNSVLKRWANKGVDTNVLQTQFDSNTIKERKVKENKEKDKDKYFFVSSLFNESFFKWMKYKSERKEKYKSIESEKSFYNKLIKLSNNNPNIAAEIIEQSMANNYAGIFELKKGTEKIKPRVYN